MRAKQETVYRAANREKIKEVRDAYYAANRDRILQEHSAYAKAHPELGRGRARKRRAVVRGNAQEPYTEAEILELYGTDCYLCGGPIDLEALRSPGQPGWEKSLHMEHIIPVSKNGPDTKANVRPAHGWCNLSKHDRILDLTPPASDGILVSSHLEFQGDQTW